MTNIHFDTESIDGTGSPIALDAKQMAHKFAPK